MFTTNLSSSADSLRDLAHELFWQLLFPRKREHTEQAVFRVVLNTETRATLCDIVFELIKHDPRKFKEILRSLHELVPFYQNSDGGFCVILNCFAG